MRVTSKPMALVRRHGLRRVRLGVGRVGSDQMLRVTVLLDIQDELNVCALTKLYLTKPQHYSQKQNNLNFHHIHSSIDHLIQLTTFDREHA